MANDKFRNNNNSQPEKRIIIAERDNIAAVLENGRVSDFFIHKGDILLGDVYLARVDNILPSIDAAFVDVGSDKMGFLHAQDVMGKGALKDKLSPNQKLIVQVVKEPTGHKGPRVTTEISLPGRFLVLIPYEPGINVSKKIENSKERARLKSIVSLIKPVGVGVIIRTEAEGQSEADIQEDLEILLEKWNNIITSGESLNPPNLIYRDQDLLYRVIREACTDDVREIVVDTAFAMSRVQNILQNWHMSKNIQVTLYKGSEPLLIAEDIHKEIKAALNVKVNMPSGGYLFIQQTEALTVIDVNSGKFTSSSTQDETILKTNIEAVHEIARQLRLRNIGGMIIIDFIDMLSRADKLAIMEEMELALEPDKAKPQVGQLSDLGLVELTRHRQGQSLSEIFTKKCPHCQGSGYFMNEFNFATPSAEAEMKAKVAKAKMPIATFNKKSNNNNKNNQPNKENSMEIVEEIPVTAEENLVVEENNFDRKNKKNRRNKFNKRGKNRYREEGETPEAEVLAQIEQPIENVEVTTSQEEVKDAESQMTSEVVAAEISPEVIVEEPKKKAKRSRKTSKVKETLPEAEVSVEEPIVEAQVAAEEPVEEKPKRRPNRGSSRTAKKAKAKKTEDEI